MVHETSPSDREQAERAGRRPPSGPATGTEDLARAVAALEARVVALERLVAGRHDAPEPSPGAPAAITPAERDSGDLAGPARAPATRESSRARSRSGARLPALGRAMLVLAGAFLLRALTDAGILAGHLGASLGLGYAILVILLTDRAAQSGRRAGASLYGVAAVLVAYPFVWETATKLDLFAPSAAAAITALVTALGLGVTLRHRLRGAAWVFLGAALATATGLSWASTAPVLFATLILALGIATVWLGYIRGWTGPRWLTAALANGLVLLLILLAIRSGEAAPGRPQPAAGAVLALALALPASYLGSFFGYTLSGRHEAGFFEILQSLGCIVAGYLGAVLLQQSTGGAIENLGWPAVVVAAGSYAVAFAFVRRRQGRRLNFFYFAWLGLLLTVTGTALVLPDHWLPYLWSALGVVAAATGGYFDRWTLRLHCAAYLTGAAVVAGLPGVVFDAFLAPAATEWRRMETVELTTWILASLSYVMLAATQRRRVASTWRRLPRFLLAWLVLAGAGSLLATALIAGLGQTAPGSADALAAAVRTVVLALTTVLLSALGRTSDIAELSWFVNPLLVATGLKLLLEDLRRGTPISLFLGFACFGAALILAPRLRRRHPLAGEPAASPVEHT
jgi:hypothetical protein